MILPLLAVRVTLGGATTAKVWLVVSPAVVMVMVEVRGTLPEVAGKVTCRCVLSIHVAVAVTPSMVTVTALPAMVVSR